MQWSISVIGDLTFAVFTCMNDFPDLFAGIVHIVADYFKIISSSS